MNLAPDELELSKVQHDEALVVLSQNSVQLLDCELWQLVKNTTSYPLVHVLSVHGAMVEQPVPARYFAIEGEGRVGSVEFELGGWYVQKLNPGIQVFVGWDNCLELLVLWGVSVTVEEHCHVFGSDFLKKLLFLFDHEGGAGDEGDEQAEG